MFRALTLLGAKEGLQQDATKIALLRRNADTDQQYLQELTFHVY